MLQLVYHKGIAAYDPPKRSGLRFRIRKFTNCKEKDDESFPNIDQEKETTYIAQSQQMGASKTFVGLPVSDNLVGFVVSIGRGRASDEDFGVGSRAHVLPSTQIDVFGIEEQGMGNPRKN
nr:hypothetical protein Iba_chr05eCG6230 [Ipomoea batatas]